MGEGQIIIGIMVVVVLVFILLIALAANFKTFGKVMGVVFLIPGLAALVYGIIRANSFQSQFARSFGGDDEIMILCLVLGGISTVLGIILLIVSFSGTNKPDTYNYNQTPLNYNQTPLNYNQTPVNYNQVPVNYNQVPINYNDAAATYTQASVTNNQTPETYDQAPVESNTNRYIVKVRCSKCQALNDETSNFCNVCANPIGDQKIES